MLGQVDNPFPAKVVYPVSTGLSLADGKAFLPDFLH